jgi:hypothetical protein
MSVRTMTKFSTLVADTVFLRREKSNSNFRASPVGSDTMR